MEGTVESLSDSPADKLRRIIDHVFLPRKLPGRESGRLAQDEAYLLSLLVETVATSAYADIIPNSTKNLFEGWGRVQASHQPTPSNISNELKKMNTGGMFGLYIRAQNVGILISADTKDATLTTFPASMNNITIMSAEEVISTYPEQAIKIPRSELLTSEALARQIVTLTNQIMVDAQQISKKAGSEGVEVHDVPDTVYVSEWLTCLLSDANSNVATDFPQICKKVRDQIVWQDSLVPFRRSGLWMTAKVFLQLSLQKATLDEPKGTFLYKLLLAEFMRHMCLLAMESSLDSDIGMHMIRKLARRVKKVQALPGSISYKVYMQKLLTETSNTCLEFKSQMKMVWDDQIKKTWITLPPVEVNPLDTIHSQLPIIPSLRGLGGFSGCDNATPKCSARVKLTSAQIPDIKILTKDKSKETVGNVLYETESWIFKYLDCYVNHDQGKDFVVPIRELADDYINLAPDHYMENPLRTSRMTLAFLKIIHILDQIAVQCHPMLKEHRIGVDPVIIQQLLLPWKSELQLAHTIELYCKYRDKNAKYPALTEEEIISSNSFSVRYATQNQEMCDLKEKILLDAEHKIIRKRGELKGAKNTCNKFREKLRGLGCVCYRVNNSKSCAYHHVTEALQSQTVRVYERPLRPESHNQLAVVFELLIPPEIACLRDAIALLLSSICRSTLINSPKDIVGIWTNYNKLSKPKKNYSKGMEIQKYFRLGSTTKLFRDSHYCESHPDNSESTFIVNNGYNCTFDGNYKKMWRNLKNWTTLSVESNSIYATMQWTLESTNHFQNQVLARQVECPEKLRPLEYKEFGSLRAGHRLQLKNIIRALITKSLSLKEESVFALICQAVWEAGPPSDSWVRDSHEELTLSCFAEEWLHELNHQLDAYENNWTEGYTLLLIVVLACRALEFEQMKNETVELILKCRKTAFKWIKSIEEMIAKSVQTSTAGHLQDLKMKLLDASVCLCWTYNVGNEFLDLILKSEDDVFLWTHALTRVFNITCSAPKHSSKMKNMLLEGVRYISLNIVLKLVSFIQGGLNKFIGQNWSEANDGILKSWTPFKIPAAHVYETTFQRVRNQGTVHLQVDILRGSFLVNGLPDGYLPEEIAKHTTFTRTFQSIVFEVYPALEEKTFVTKHRYNNSDYRFTLMDEHTLVIRERRWRNTNKDDFDEFQLIPCELFKNLIPLLLIQDYSHWLNVKRNWIDFRAVRFDEFDNQKSKFRFSLNSKKLYELSTWKEIFCVTSLTQRSITTYLGRLENPKFIHAMLTKDGKTLVNLPRMRLNFELKGSGHLENLEYGMAVLSHQNLGTLIGLRHGLLMENVFGEQKLLVPHGSAQVVGETNATGIHQVKIDLATLHNPPVFCFDLEFRLQQLRSGKSTTGWFYLAYLHALTASPLADPFTKLNGTESAFGILQSGLCWSCKPYESNETLNILGEIKKLAPIRQFYPKHLTRMETIEWPTGIPSCAAQDGYRFIVDKLRLDSNRMAVLFKNDPDTSHEAASDSNSEFLTKRAYLRYEPLNSTEGKVSLEFLSILPTDPVETDRRTWKTSPVNAEHTRIISELGHSWQYKPPSSPVPLTDYLVSNDELNGLSDPLALTKMSIIELLQLEFRNIWINLYELARSVKLNNLKSEWTTLLSILAFRGENLNHLLLLQGVAVHRVFFQAQNPPTLEKFIRPNDFFTETRIQQVFTQYRAPNPIHLASLVAVLWPLKSLNSKNFEDLVFSNLDNALNIINKKFLAWNQNLELKTFVDKIDRTIQILPAGICRTIGPTSLLHLQQPVALVESFLGKNKFVLDFKNMIVFKTQNLATEDEIFKSGFLNCPLLPESIFKGSALLSHFEAQKKFYKEKSSAIQTTIENCLIHDGTSGLFHSDLFRVTPASLLTQLLKSKSQGVNPHLRTLIGAMGVLWTLEQRAIRCIRFYKMGNAGTVSLIRERENRGHTNWSPADIDKTEWLLFEIESNLMIRPVQIEVAEQMMNPPGGKHSVMQLNMGEGKTAVIVPIIALALANGKQLCRVTVLKSLFKTNFASLVLSLGGLLNRRLYTFPCQRDLGITDSTASTMLELYKECCSRQGVVLTLPEHRLSFQLKGYEKSRANDIPTAKGLLETRNWLDNNVRDILDESDEILHVKYQLIYTLGSQLAVDGGSLRWSVAQSLLKLLPYRMADLQNADKFGDSYVDSSISNFDERPEIFHHTRILRKECYKQLIHWLASDILKGKAAGIKVPELDTEEKERLMMELLTNTAINEEDHKNALSLLSPTQETTILVLMGYLKFEILYLTLSKRWRVSYGVDVEGERRMAVPFRAKDIPSKRTEFGHPDVAIMLTQLSYYYSGLSNEQLEECFTRLNFVPNKEEEYASWIRHVPCQYVDSSIKSLSGVNLVDLKQKYDKLFPVLERNMLVVDFWLSQVVFPKESRVFEKKIVSTPWDLCSEDFKHPITGFSGTNDSTVLLPATITQQDLPQLQSTNKHMRDVLLLEENNNLEILTRGITAREILKKLISKRIPVLLDSGAVMLELDNEGVARTWLKLLQESGRNDREAAVYYNDDNELRVKHRDYPDESKDFHSSSYVEKLERCVIYLDDVHTRGTDLRIPPPSKACVTLCAGITRDKMVQACMRMRLLGQGHTIEFFANDEAGNGLSSLTVDDVEEEVMSECDEESSDVEMMEIPEEKKEPEQIGSAHVMRWVCQNSREFEKNGLVYWATSGLNYGHKRFVDSVFNGTQKSPEDYVAFGQMCCDKEYQALKDMFGTYRSEINYLDILQSQVQRKICDVTQDLNSRLEFQAGATKYNRLMVNVGLLMKSRCEKYIPDKTVVSHLLDEEQEKEHEEEPENEREIIRPPPADPAPHNLAEEVKLFIRTGDSRPGFRTRSIVPLYEGLKKTTMWDFFNYDWCKQHVFATEDFISVIKPGNPGDKTNEFLRTPNWIAYFGQTQNFVDQLLLLSPFEANELIPIIKSSPNCASLRMYAPRLVPMQPILINSSNLTLSSLNIQLESTPEVPRNFLPPLLLFSGSLYFLNSDEQGDFCTFIGILPHDRTKVEENACKNGKCDRGFLRTEFRQEVAPIIHDLCRFEQHPEALIRGIIEARHDYFPTMSHVSKLVLDCRRVSNFKN